RIEVGPLTYIRQDNERVLFSPVHMVMVPPRHYCVVLNPVARNQDGEVLFDPSGQAKLRHADLEIRLAQDPFPLYPGEEIQQDVTPLQIVYPDTALRLQALLDFQEDGGEKRVAGDEWLFEGPGTYIPRKEVVVLETIKATVIGENQAIRLRARKEGSDRGGVHRVTGGSLSACAPGEEWLVRKVGAYLPGAHEEVIDIVTAFVLTDKVTPPFALIGCCLDQVRTPTLTPHPCSASESPPCSRPEGLQGRRRARAPHRRGVAGDGSRQGGSHPVGGGGGGGRGAGDHPEQPAVLRGPGPCGRRRETSAGEEAGGEGQHRPSSGTLQPLLFRSACLLLLSVSPSGRVFLFPAAGGAAGGRHPGRLRPVRGGGAGPAGCGGLP
ncbi:unnamed protein product, partial [Tetraodon nigroviridis]